MVEKYCFARTAFRFLLATILSFGAVLAHGQWLNVPAGIPKTKEGKPNLTAAAPRKPDGKPDLSGIWSGDREYIGRYVRADGVFDFAADFRPGEFPVQAWAEALSRERNNGGAFPPAHCLPPGIPMLDLGAAVHPLKIVQEPALIVILYEFFGANLQVFIDGRTLAGDANPTWLGYSVGRWDGDTLVVDSAGFNARTWIDVAGHPSTDALKIAERFRRRDFGHLDLEVTIDDPKAYTKPWTVTLPLHLFAEGDLLEFVCNENEGDVKHIVNK